MLDILLILAVSALLSVGIVFALGDEPFYNDFDKEWFDERDSGEREPHYMDFLTEAPRWPDE